jgi:hypothetical protein
MKVPGASRFFSPFFCLVLLFGCCSSAWISFSYAEDGDLLTPVSPVALAPPAAFVKITVPAQGKVLTALPFVPFTQSVSDTVRCISGLGNWPLKLIRWNALDLGYETLDYGDSGWQRTPAENGNLFGLQPGDGFWLENKGSQPVDCMVMGRIPVDPYLTNTFLSGLALFGLPYPTARALSDTPLAEEIAANGDRIYTWSGTNYTILTHSNSLEVSQGYWYQRNGEPVVWSVERPYGSIFKEGALPAVIAMGSRSQGSIFVTIRPDKGETVDMLVQDLVNNAGFKADGVWQVVGMDLDGKGKDLDFVDQKGGEGRVYLVLNSKDRDQIYETAGENARLRPEWTRMDGDLAFDLQYLNPSPDVFVQGDLDKKVAIKAGNMTMIPSVSIHRTLVHVDHRSGRDTFSGHFRSVSGNDGPKKTIQAGLKAAEKGGTVVVHDGTYLGNHLNIAGRDVNVQVVGQVDLK